MFPHVISRTSLLDAIMCTLMTTKLPVARRKLELYAIEAADAMLADVLRQLPCLTVSDTILCGRHRHTQIYTQSAEGLCSNVTCNVDRDSVVVVVQLLIFPVSSCQDLDVIESEIAAESLASIPVSLRRLMMRGCCGVTASSLASIKRLSALKKLALDCLSNAGGDNALQLLAWQLPAGLTYLGFSRNTGARWEVSARGWRQHSFQS